MSSFYVPTESLMQSRAFRRLLGVSLAGHLLVYGILVFKGFSNRSDLISSSPVMVQMVSMPKAAAPPKAAPAKPTPPKAQPKPPEPAPPPKPVVKEIVIPKELRPLPDKPKPKPVEAKPVTPPPSADELIQKMTERVEAEEAAKAPPAQEAESESSEVMAGSPGRFDPLFSPWVANVQTRVRANWSGASVCQKPPQFNVDVDAAGHLSGIDLAETSGDKYCDDTAERALRKSDPLPPPPQAGSFTLVLIPKESQ